MKKLLLLTLLSMALTGCIRIDPFGATDRAQIYADASVDRAHERRMADEARYSAALQAEYARQDGKSERMQTWLIVLIILVGGGLAGLYLYWRGKTHYELARQGAFPQLELNPRQLPGYYAALPAGRQQSAIIVVSDEQRDLRLYARSVGGKLAIDDVGYKVYLPDGQTQRLLPMKDGEA